MIDYKLILKDKESVKRELAKKNFGEGKIDALESVLIEMRARKAEINELYRDKRARESERRLGEAGARTARGRTPAMELLRERIAAAERELKQLEISAQALLFEIPNLPDTVAPIGTDESADVVLFEAPYYQECESGNPAPHWDVAEKLGILDASCAGRISGRGFGLFKGKGAKLIRALVNYCLSLHEGKYLELLPPHLVTTEALTMTGHLPKFVSDQYKCEKDDLWLIPTAEVPMTAAFADTVFQKGSLPKYCMGYTLAFRREIGATGRGTRGLQRVHEFHKVELLKIVEPSMVQPELDDLLEDCVKIIRDLKLRYRIVEQCTGRMGDKYSRCFDIEVYSPGVKKWLEVASVGHFSDYQARRAGIKYIDEKGKKRTAFTMNGSGIATARVWLSIIETYQRADGSVKVPEVLTPFMGCDSIY